MPGEYGLKKDRDRKFFTGEFLWSGIDYLGEPTPYNSHFPVKASFFGAVDTAGFPKDLFYAFVLLLFDAGGLGLFCLTGTLKAREVERVDNGVENGYQLWA